MSQRKLADLVLEAGIENKAAFEFKIRTVSSVQEGRCLPSSLLPQLLLVLLKVYFLSWLLFLRLEEFARCLLNGLAHPRPSHIPSHILLWRGHLLGCLPLIRLIDYETLGEIAPRTGIG